MKKQKTFVTEMQGGMTMVRKSTVLNAPFPLTNAECIKREVK